jgi:hypothetical protein
MAFLLDWLGWGLLAPVFGVAGIFVTGYFVERLGPGHDASSLVFGGFAASLGCWFAGTRLGGRFFFLPLKSYTYIYGVLFSLLAFGAANAPPSSAHPASAASAATDTGTDDAAPDVAAHRGQSSSLTTQLSALFTDHAARDGKINIVASVQPADANEAGYPTTCRVVVEVNNRTKYHLHDLRFSISDWNLQVRGVAANQSYEASEFNLDADDQHSCVSSARYLAANITKTSVFDCTIPNMAEGDCQQLISVTTNASDSDNADKEATLRKSRQKENERLLQEAAATVEKSFWTHMNGHGNEWYPMIWVKQPTKARVIACHESPHFGVYDCSANQVVRNITMQRCDHASFPFTLSDSTVLPPLEKGEIVLMDPLSEGIKQLGPPTQGRTNGVLVVAKAYGLVAYDHSNGREDCPFEN